jgi:CobQ-like glutamine amidotransferase family enzyme
LYKSAIGTYLHGPFLPKNPVVADFLLAKAIAKIDSNFQLDPIDDSLAAAASAVVQTLPQ